MNDAISRSAVLWITAETGALETQRRVRELPALDAVPVVRCVDCKYRCTLVCPMQHTETYYDYEGFDYDYDVDRTDNDGFCHLGERWDGEEE